LTPTLPLARHPLLPRAARLAQVLQTPVWEVLQTLAWVVLRMPAWEVLQASQATLEVVPAPVQADLRALQVAQDFLTSVPLLEVQLKAMLMLQPKLRLLLRLLVQSAPALEVRVTPPPDLVEKSLA
jgi:hypothetical protein